MSLTKHSAGGAGYFEPELQHTFLPGCRNCGGAHPLARKPQMPADTCPDCGQPAGAVGETKTEKATFGGSTMLVGRAMLAIGRALNKFSKRI